MRKMHWALLALVSAALLLRSCIIAPDNSGDISVGGGDTTIVIFGGDESSEPDPESVAVDGLGVWFKDLEVDSGVYGGAFSLDFTLTMRNVGSETLESVSITLEIHYADGNRDTEELSATFDNGFLPSEYRTTEWSHAYNSALDHVRIISARLDAASSGTDPVVVNADPVITFSIPLQNLIFGGDDPVVATPDAFVMGGFGVWFRDIDDDVTVYDYSDDSHQFTITVKNVGSVTLDGIRITVDMYFDDADRDTVEVYENLYEFMTGEYKTITWSHSHDGLCTAVEILSAKLEPDSYSLDDVVLPADPVISFTIP